MKRRTTLAVAAAAFFALQNCGGSKAPTSNKVNTNFTLEQLDSIGKNFKASIGTYGGVMNLPLAADPDGFCPALSSSGYSMEVMGYIFEGLITTDPATLEYIPNLAEKWDVSEDGLVWTFYLKKGVLFSDGEELTADDVLFTFNDVVYNDALRSPLNYNFRVNGKKIKVEKSDDYTVQFTLPDPFAPFLTVAGMSIMPEHKYAEAAKAGTLESFLSNGAKPEDVVGTGPFKLSKVELGQRITLVRNDNYRKKDAEGNKLPYLDGVNLLIIKEPNVQMMKFKSGEIDHLIVQGEHFPILKPEEAQRGYSIYRVGPSWYDPFFKFNQNNQKDESGKPFLSEKKQEWFRTKEFRQACAFAVNYDEIININYNGLAYQPAGVWGAHKGKFHNPEAKKYFYDTKTADSLLTSIGMIDRDGDGVREDESGVPVEFTLTTSAGVKLIEDIYSIVRKDLEEVGLKVHLNLIEFNTLIARTMDTYNWDAVAFAQGGIRDPHFGKSSVSSNSFRYIINPQRKGKDGEMLPKEDRPFELRINEIFEEAVGEMDEEKRIKLYQEWQAIAQEECLTINMPLKEVILGGQNRFGNVHLTSNLALGQSLFHNVDELYLLQK